MLSENKKITESIMREFKERAVKSFLDIIILIEMKDRLLSGYDVISIIYKKYYFLISAGTVYSILYKLERDKFVEGNSNGKKTVFRLTEKGKFTIEIMLKEPLIKYNVEAFHRRFLNSINK